MLKSTCVPGTGANFIPRLFCHGWSLVAFSRTLPVCSSADGGLAIRSSPANDGETIRRLPRIAARRWSVLFPEQTVRGARLGAKRKYAFLNWFSLGCLKIAFTTSCFITDFRASTSRTRFITSENIPTRQTSLSKKLGANDQLKLRSPGSPFQRIDTPR